AESAGTRSRAPLESTPSRARAASLSRGRRSPERPALSSGGSALAGRGRRSRSSGSQVGKILLHQVNRIRQIACLPDLHGDNRLARFDCRLKSVLQLVGRIVEAEAFGNCRPQSPQRCSGPRILWILVT